MVMTASELSTSASNSLYRSSGAASRRYDRTISSIYMILPTQITYNAALRGIVATAVSEPEPIRDEALQGGFGLYNLMTHDPHIPRNSKTIQYMLRLINKTFPTSRVKGNMSVTLFHDACELGVVTKDLVEDVLRVHTPSNGPEFDIFLEEIQKEQPQQSIAELRR